MRIRGLIEGNYTVRKEEDVGGGHDHLCIYYKGKRLYYLHLDPELIFIWRDNPNLNVSVDGKVKT